MAVSRQRQPTISPETLTAVDLITDRIMELSKNPDLEPGRAEGLRESLGLLMQAQVMQARTVQQARGQ